MIQENTILAGRYQLLRLLSKSDFSEVWLANDMMINLEVVVKIYAPRQGLDDDGINQFQEEFAFLFDKNHSNLLKPSNLEVHDSMPFLIMPFFERGSVANMIGRIDEDTVWRILHDVASALAYLHALDPPVIYLDIKPDNILARADGHYLVTGCGISTNIRNTLRRSIQERQLQNGTIAYMGPERFSNKPAPMMASNIWSLGATLFELITSNTPFGEHGGLIQKSGAEIPDIGGNWSDDLKRIIRLCLEREVLSRPTAETLVKWAKQERIGLGEKPTSKKFKRKKFVLKIAVFLFVCIFAFMSTTHFILPETYSAEKKFQIAEDYYYGENGKELNYTKAVKWYRKAAEKGHAGAQNSLGYCYDFEKGVEQNYTEAVKWYRKAVELGHVNAQNHLGACYYYGKGVKQSYTEALEWWRKAAEQGNEWAQNNLGNCYKNGEGVEKNHSEAVKWYRKAAEQGNAESQYNLGVCYKNGEGIEQSNTEAAKWYRRAAEQGHIGALNDLGNRYYLGEGVEKNYIEALKWWRKAAEQGYANAQNNLGVCYQNGEGVEQNGFEAVTWFRKAAEQGHAGAQNNLGLCYFNEKGVEQSNAEAVTWFQKATEQGYAEAQYNLAICYKNGHGVEQNFSEAAKWYRKAAEQGHADAQHMLGICYYIGIGIEENYTEAIKWYRKAAAQGNTDAKKNLKKLGY